MADVWDETVWGEEEDDDQEASQGGRCRCRPEKQRNSPAAF